jgi:hypothetical protein
MSSVSFYEGPITNVNSRVNYPLGDVLKLIQQSSVYRILTEELRSLPDNEKSEFKKNKLPGVTFSGIFKGTRCDKNLVQHTGIIAVDIDDLSQEELERANHRIPVMIISKNIPVIAFFVSPSGNGLKVLVKVDHKESSQKDNYEAAVKLLIDTIEDIDDSKFDRSCSNVSRLCFLCHDEHIYINKKVNGDDIKSVPELDTAKWLKPPIHIEELDEGKLNKNIIDVSKEDILYSDNSKFDFKHKSEHSNFNKLLILALRKCGKYQKGNRHNYIQMLASFANQFGMPLETFIKYATSYFKEHDATKDSEAPFSIEKELTPIINDTYKRYKDQFASWKEADVIEEFTTPCFPEDVYKILPFFLKDSCKMFDNARERDVYLFAALGLLSNCFPLIQGSYDQHFIGMQLFNFIIAPASSGKGNMEWARRLGNGLDKFLKTKYKDELEQYEEELRQYEAAKGENKGPKPIKPLKQRFYIAANSSSSSMITSMHNNSFHGLMFETEADSLSNMLKNDWGNYSDILRKAFHHEPILQQRKTNDEDFEIEKSYLSMVLSGTPSQVHNLFTSVENGLFSRLLVYDFPQNRKIKNVFAKKDVPLVNYFDGMSTLLFSYAKPFFNKIEDDYSNQILFEFTPEQEERFTKWHEQKMIQLYDIYGDDIVPSVKRLGCCFFKISMILSTLRFVENKINEAYSEIGKQIICDDTDYENTETIINTLMYHTATIFRRVKRFKRNKSSVLLKDTYYNQLPPEFNRTIAMETAVLTGVNEKTAEKYLSEFIQNGKLIRHKHNHYVKPTL